jgi:hypothetical protein
MYGYHKLKVDKERECVYMCMWSGTGHVLGVVGLDKTSKWQELGNDVLTKFQVHSGRICHQPDS